MNEHNFPVNPPPRDKVTILAAWLPKRLRDKLQHIEILKAELQAEQREFEEEMRHIFDQHG
jgi:hypothetical protein